MRTFLACLALLAAGACAHSKIPKTNIDDTPENRQLIDVVGAYTKALENRDADAVLALVSPRYYEDNGNTDKADDYDYNGLRTELAKDFARTKKIQVDIKVEEVAYEPKEEKKAYVFLSYTYRAQSEFPVGTKWKTNTDRSRLTLEKDGDRWLITAGL